MAHMKWRLLLNPNLNGYRQMAIDESLYLSLNPDSSPVLRFYTWASPTLSLGSFQNYKRVVSEAFCVHNNINVVRRPTGGRAVLHQYEVTYAVVAPLEGAFNNLSLRETYQLISKPLNQALQQLGINESSISLNSSHLQDPHNSQCFVSVSRFEISNGGRKIIGSSQKRSRDRFLQHGSILLDFDPFLQQGSILHPDPEIESKIAPLNRLLGRDLSFQETSSKIAQAFSDCFGIEMESSVLHQEESGLADVLEKKYRSEEWTRKGCR
jgi:lipoyl(octanoyl) transferase